MSKYDESLLRKIARLSAVPGVKVREVCERFGVTRYAVELARELPDMPRRAPKDDLVIAMLTRHGRIERGPWPSPAALSTMASWLDYVDKDGSTADDVASRLDALIQRGVLRRVGDEYELLEPFP